MEIQTPEVFIVSDCPACGTQHAPIRDCPEAPSVELIAIEMSHWDDTYDYCNCHQLIWPTTELSNYRGLHTPGDLNYCPLKSEA